MSEIYYWLGFLAFWMGSAYGVLSLVASMIELVACKGVKTNDVYQFVKWRNRNKEMSDNGTND